MVTSEISGPPLDGPVPTLKKLLIKTVEKYADKTALVALHQPSNRFDSIKQSDSATYLRWTYTELYEAAKRLATTFKAQGLKRGDPIAVLLLNGVEWPLIFWAALLIDCPVVSLDFQAPKNAEVIQHMLTVSKAKALVAWDANMVTTLCKSATQQVEELTIKLVACEDEPIKGWQSLSSCVAESSTLADFEGHGDEEDVVTILFTSGTTSLPKGCEHTNRTLTSMVRTRIWNSGLDETRTSLAHLPNFHVFALIYNWPYWLLGGKVVYPAASFSPKATLSGINLEQCTDMGAAPSHITQLVDHLLSKENSTNSLYEVLIGGAMVSPDILKACIDDLGSKKASPGFGMTEGTPTIGHQLHSYDQIPQSEGTDVSCGVPPIGAHVRVCAPGSRVPLERGEPGELHMGGAQVIRGYLAGAKGDFYEDEKGPWLATGDQAKMLPNGQVCVIGRFKDLIIRGGENIAPSRIEAVANAPSDVNVQVVAAPDEVSGEVPVAVVKYAEGATTSATSLRETVLTELGPTMALDDVIDIRDLGIEDFPKTTTGKVQKVVLTQKVRDYVMTGNQQDQGEASKTENESEQSLKTTLRQMWAKLLGVPGEKLSDEQSLKEFADSLTTMQFRGRLKTKLQKTMSLDDLSENDTIGKQARFLLDGSNPAGNHTAATIRRDGPPRIEDMPHLNGDASAVAELESCAASLLNNYELSWADDVEDILPTQDVSRQFLRRLRPQSSNHRHAYLSKVNVSQLQEVLQAALAAHPMLRTLAMDFEGDPYHVIVRPGPRWWKHCISSEGHTVKEPEDVQDYLLNDPELDFANTPGPLFRCVIVNVESTNSAAFIYQVHHSIFDGISIPFLIDSVDLLLGGSSLPQRTSFKSWADMYHAYRDSAPASADAAYHAKNLKGISSAPLWPSLRAPGCFKGCDVGWIDEETGTPGDPSARSPLDGPEATGVKGVLRKFSVPGMATVRQQHNMSAAVVVKAAVAIYNALVNKSDIAVFCTYQASRSWPFVLPWISQYLPDAVDVDGPTLTFCANKITVDMQGPVGKTLQGVQDQEHELESHAHAPHSKIRDLLSHDDAATYTQVMRRQIFNWVPGLGSSEGQWDNLTKLQQQSRMDHAFMWNCNMADSETLIIHASYDDAQLRAVEVEEAVERLGSIAAAITQPGSWDSELASVM